MTRFIVALYLILSGAIVFRMIIPFDAEREFSPSQRHEVQQRIKVADRERVPVPPLFGQVADEFSLHPEILNAIADHESGYNPWALNIEGRSVYPDSREEALAIIEKYKGKSYDVGLMQVNSYWIRKFDLSPAEALEPEENLRLGAWILRYCLDRYGYNWRAIGAYHTGSPKNLPGRARAYAVKVMKKYNALMKNLQLPGNKIMPNTEYVIFEVDSCKFALPSVAVDRVERAVQLTPVPDAPAPVLGVVNHGGDIVPVLGLRGSIGGEERDVMLSDRLIFSSANGRRMAVVADSISDVIEIDDKAARDADEIWPGISLLKSLAGMGTDVVLVQDMSKLLDPEQEMDLLAAIAAMNEAEDSAADD